MKLRSYSSSFNLGHRALENLWDGEVVIQEKIDGSQFSFGVDEDGVPYCRSKNVQIDMDDPGMFGKAVQTVRQLADEGVLEPGWTYRGEYLRKPKHNTLAYEQTPPGNIVIFDIDKGNQRYLTVDQTRFEASRLSLYYAPVYAVVAKKPSLDKLKEILEREKPILGGEMIEGIALKNYGQLGPDKKILFAKLVSEDFKERHKKDWKIRNPGQRQFVQLLVEEFQTEARWSKAIQHLAERGELEYEPRDIPKVIQEIQEDVLKDAGDEIKEKLFEHFWRDIRKGIIKGSPEFYKAWLAERQLKEAA